MAVSLVKTPRKKRKTSQSIDWVQVLIDQLLELQSRPLQLWRNVVKQAFKLVSGYVSSEALQLIINVSILLMFSTMVLLCYSQALQPQDINELMEEEEDEVAECDSDEDDSDDEEEDEDMEDALGSQFHDADAEMRAEIREALGTLAVHDSDQVSIIPAARCPFTSCSH